MAIHCDKVVPARRGEGKWIFSSHIKTAEEKEGAGKAAYLFQFYILHGYYVATPKAKR